MGFSNLNNPANYQLAQFGQKGFRVLEGAASATGSPEFYNVIYITDDCTLTATSDTSGDNISSLEVVAGTTIVGRFSAVSIAGTGSAICYIA